ncbi:MAG: thiamine-monophosphate kinase, partial [Pyrinomonadaceae bacterium]|nr:thiamine-monophosphate kinase [Pyrinomonadaceae bacterium]
NAVLRSGAKVGDLIFVTGMLGGAAAGLKLLENGEHFDIANTENVESSQSPNHNLMLRQLKPNSQTIVGKLLPRECLATSAIDLSDGLSSDLRHVCEASGVGAKIYVDKLPFDVNLLDYSEAEKLDFALNGGEDYELLFTVRPRMARNRSKLLAKFPSTCIGEITDDAGKIELVSENEVVTLENRGFQHF